MGFFTIPQPRSKRNPPRRHNHTCIVCGEFFTNARVNSPVCPRAACRTFYRKEKANAARHAGD